jgi:hypothetical protein
MCWLLVGSAGRVRAGAVESSVVAKSDWTEEFRSEAAAEREPVSRGYDFGSFDAQRQLAGCARFAGARCERYHAA